MTDFDRLLPPNSTQLERDVIRIAPRELPDTAVLADIWNPDTCPAKLLPWLAWAVGVEMWDGTWADVIKRNIIKATPDIRRHRGTVWAVRRALTSAGY